MPQYAEYFSNQPNIYSRRHTKAADQEEVKQKMMIEQWKINQEDEGE